MPFSQGVHAWIEVDGHPLPEYKAQVDPRRTTCFIPSEEGKKFSIRFQNLQPVRLALRGNIFLDGLPAGAGLLLSTDTHATKVSGQTRWEGLECPFQFSKLRTTDDETEACQDENRLRELGTVRLQIEWVEVVRQEEWRPPSTSASANEPVFERSKKASAHCASFGNMEMSRPKHWYSTNRIPFVEPMEFIFQYAPRDWLQAKDIIPSAPVPSTSTSLGLRKRIRSHEEAATESGSNTGSASDELLDDEEAAVYQRLKAKLAARQSRKRRKVKSEPREDSRVNYFTPGEVIDLTGDD